MLMCLQALGWLVLAVYLDNVLPGPNKRARPPWYFLVPSYWTRTQGARCGLSARQQQQLLVQARATGAMAGGRALKVKTRLPGLVVHD